MFFILAKHLLNSNSTLSEKPYFSPKDAIRLSGVCMWSLQPESTITIVGRQAPPFISLMKPSRLPVCTDHGGALSDFPAMHSISGE